MADSERAMTTAGLQAKVHLRRAWFETHPNRPIPESRAEVERLFAAIEAEAAQPSAEPLGLDVERLGFRDLLDIADALLAHYPPDTIVCSHVEQADIGARTVAGIADLIASCRLALAEPAPEGGEGTTVTSAAEPSLVAADGHEHYWVDAPDDETGWHCTICGLTVYPEPPYGAEPAPEGGEL